MADNSLDDFFAKKDKSKKSKNKGKFMTSELGLGGNKAAEESKKQEKTLKKDKERTAGGGNQISNTTVEPPQEWKEIEEQEKDYSGLRIQTLTITDREKEDEQSRDTYQQDDGDDFKTNEMTQGPWRMQSSNTPSSEPAPLIVEKEEEVEKPEPEVNPVKPQKYVPPHRTSGSASMQTPSSNSYSSRRYGKSVPEMDSEEHFPSLSSASDSDKKGPSSDDKSFQSVTRGYKTVKDSPGGVRLDLGNKYSALRQRDLN